MPNTFLPERFVEIVHRLAAGVEPWDPVRRQRHRAGIVVTADSIGDPPGRPFATTGAFERALARLEPHPGGRFSLRHRPGLVPPLAVRLFEPSGARLVVPRRMVLPVPSWDDLVDGDLPGGTPVPVAVRTFRVALLPGAAAEAAGICGVRGLLEHADGSPVRWGRVEAFLRRPDGQPGVPVGVAHGDDRGEFVLVPDLQAVTGSRRDPLPLLLRVHGRTPPPLPPLALHYLAGRFDAAPMVEPARSRALAAAVADPLWDLPPEPAAVPSGSPDPVADGLAVPGVLDRSNSPDTPVDLPHGRIVTVPPITWLP